MLGSGLRAPGIQNQVFAIPASPPESPFPTSDRNKLLITQHPTRGPDSLRGNTPSSPLNDVISLLDQRKNGEKGNTDNKKQSPFSMIVNYLLRKKLGVLPPGSSKLQPTQSQGSAISGNPKKSMMPNFANLFKVTPQSSQTSSNFDIFSYLLNQKRPQKSEENTKNLTSQTTLLNVLHTKVGLNPNTGINLSSPEKLRPGSYKWSHLPKTTPVRIQPMFEDGNFTLPPKTCFPGMHRQIDVWLVLLK